MRSTAKVTQSVCDASQRLKKAKILNIFDRSAKLTGYLTLIYFFGRCSKM